MLSLFPPSSLDIFHTCAVSSVKWHFKQNVHNHFVLHFTISLINISTWKTEKRPFRRDIYCALWFSFVCIKIFFSSSLFIIKFSLTKAHTLTTANECVFRAIIIRHTWNFRSHSVCKRHNFPALPQLNACTTAYQSQTIRQSAFEFVVHLNYVRRCSVNCRGNS